MSGERERLARAAARLEEVGAAIAAGGEDGAGLERLAEEALALSSEILELVPRAIAEAEARAGQGRGAGGG